MKRTLIASILMVITTTTIAGAVDGDKRVTSKNYVDTAIETRQEKITAGTSGSVVTYDGTQDGQTQFSERGILNSENIDMSNDSPNGHYSMYEVSDEHSGDLVPADIYIGDVNMLMEDIDSMSGDTGTVAVRGDNGLPSDARGIYDGSTTYNSSTDADKLITAGAVQSTQETITTSKLTCANDDCTLWTIDDQSVYGPNSVSNENGECLAAGATCTQGGTPCCLGACRVAIGSSTGTCWLKQHVG